MPGHYHLNISRDEEFQKLKKKNTLNITREGNKKKPKGNPILTQLVSVEAELDKLKKLYEEKVTKSPVKDKEFLSKQLMKDLKINRRNLGIHTIGPGGASSSLSDLISKLEQRQGALKGALGSRHIGDNAILAEFGIRNAKSIRGEEFNEDDDINPQWLSQYDSDTKNSKESKLGGIKIADQSSVVKAADVQEEIQQEKATVKNRDPKDPMKTDIWTVDPRTGKEVGVITNAQRRNLELYLQKQNKKPERSPGLYIQSST